MLNIYFGSKKNEIYNTDMYYKNQYDKNWVTDSFAKQVIKEIDNSIVIGPDEIKNDIFGVFNSKELSTGVKTLLLLKNEPKKIFNISNCGDNCAKAILKLAEKNDITVCLHHIMDFGDKFELTIINKGKVVIKDDAQKYILLANEYLKKDE